MYVEHCATEDDGLTSELWRFYVGTTPTGIEVKLQAWYVRTRATKRHKWVNQKGWVSIYDRHLNNPEPAIPEHVRAAVCQQIMAAINFSPVM